MFLVYSLHDPDTDEIRYIGQTGRTLDERLVYHIEKPTNYLTEAWFKSLANEGKVPHIKLIKAYKTRKSAMRREALEIRKRKGLRLLNIENNKYAQSRTKVLSIKVTERELDIVRARAKGAGLHLRDFIRAQMNL